MPVIRFDAAESNKRNCPHPYPAARGVPAWMKKTPMAVAASEKLMTVKRCPPFLEAMTGGYIIPLAEECTFFRDEQGKVQANSDHNIVEGHGREQYVEAPFSHYPVVKFLNPWVVVTEPGYSTLFIAPLNRWDTPFHPLAGVVETDTYYNHINFPAICTLPPNSRFVMPKGAPVIQVIPFKREQWSSGEGELDIPRIEKFRAEVDADEHAYKVKYWLKHSYE